MFAICVLFIENALFIHITVIQLETDKVAATIMKVKTDQHDWKGLLEIKRKINYW